MPKLLFTFAAAMWITSFCPCVAADQPIEVQIVDTLNKV